jgi:hypothetical protein
MARTMKVPVTSRALMQRLNRAMLHQDLVVKKTRGDGRARQELGEFYLVSSRINGVADKNIDLEYYGREYGVLAEYEEVRDD